MNSVLNPEAPEFHPHITTLTKDGYTTVRKTIKSSKSWPYKVSYQIYKTYTDFNVVTAQISENVIKTSNQIVTTELPLVRFKCSDLEYNTDLLIDANDTFLDRISINIDTESGVNKPSDKFLKGVLQKREVSSWNTTPIITKKQLGSAIFIGAKNIPRPQLNFKDAIDNSESLWVPKIADKPNNIKPLALNILYNEDGEAVGYEHPYKVELDLYHPPEDLLVPGPEEAVFPAPIKDSHYIYIDTEEKLNELVEHLNTVSELAVDLEHHSYRTYQGITCLIQISTDEGGDFIVDALAVREHIHKLNQAFTDPKKLKVFHGADCDVLWLQRDFGVYLVGLFDTHQAARILKLTGLSLKYLLMKYCGVEVDKKYQLADWRMRPLPDELLEYARMDTHYLLFIWRQMRAELLSKASSQPHLLLSVFEQSRQIALATYNKEVISETSHMPLYLRSRKSFNTQQMAALKMLYKWRDAQARLLDESCTYLIPNHMMLSLAEMLPRELQGVNAMCNPMPPFVKQNLIVIHKMLLSCRELPNEPQLYQMPPSIRTMVNEHQLHTYTVHDLHPEFNEEYEMSVELSDDLYDMYSQYCTTAPAPSMPIVSSDQQIKAYETIVSDLNAEAKQFIPPFDRYRKYRSLAQMEEIKEFKEKEAKIAAIGQGNELIKTEVLVKLQQAKTQIENEEKRIVPTEIIEIDDDDTSTKTQQRKRKISPDKMEIKESLDTTLDHKKTELANSSNQKTDSNTKPYDYKNVNYKKFYNDMKKDFKQKQPKMKFKKYKK